MPAQHPYRASGLVQLPLRAKVPSGRSEDVGSLAAGDGPAAPTITYLGRTDEPLLRHTVFVGLRDDKPAREVRREVASRP